MSEVIWKRIKIWRFEIRTTKTGYWIGIEYRPKKGWVHDVKISSSGISYQKLPF